MKGVRMARRRRMRPDDATTRDTRSRWRLRVAATLGGSVLGLVTSLYPEELRQLLETSVGGLAGPVLPIALTALVASGCSVLTYELVFRRQRPGRVTAGQIQIEVDALPHQFQDRQAVANRKLHFLQARRRGNDLVVLLHGLGLDATDFRPVMAESDLHSIALTQYGFNRIERDDPDYRPISLLSHIQLLGYALRTVRRAYPRKRISLVGFSVGADLLLMLAEQEPHTLQQIQPRRVLLLDPNVNQSTTTFSSAIAGTSGDREVRELVSILRSARTQSEVGYLSEYVSKIASKNFAHVRSFAKEIAARYRGEAKDPFLTSLEKLTQLVNAPRVVLSRDHEKVFNDVHAEAAARGLDVRLECSLTSHFDLLRPNFLTWQLSDLR